MTAPAPWWQSTLVGFDTETTGVDVFSDRIVTATIVTVTPGQRPAFREWLINPGIDIPADATAIHGITTESAYDCGLNPAEALYEISGLLALAIIQHTPIVAYNASFDLSLIEAENNRHDLPTITERLDGQPIAPVIDPFVIDRELDKYRRGKRTLAAVCQHHHVTLPAAHSASADALAAVRLAIALAPGVKDLTAMQLHDAQTRWHAERQRDFAAYLLKNGKDASDVSTDWPLRTAPDTPTRIEEDECIPF